MNIKGYEAGALAPAWALVRTTSPFALHDPASRRDIYSRRLVRLLAACMPHPDVEKLARVLGVLRHPTLTLDALYSILGQDGRPEVDGTPEVPSSALGMVARELAAGRPPVRAAEVAGVPHRTGIIAASFRAYAHRDGLLAGEGVAAHA